jgi:hypothetical protein
MNPEDLYADLFKVASAQGSLDDAAAEATEILGLPRYAGDPRRLARDIKTVIDRITEQSQPVEAGPKKQAASKRLRLPAQWYFSIKGEGQAISNRRIAEGDPGGSARTWMDVGVIYRVAAGLMGLWHETASTSDKAAGGTYRLELVDLRRTIHDDILYATIADTLSHQVLVTSPGPHLLMLPFGPSRTTLERVAPDQPGAYPPAQLVSVKVPGGARAAVVFGGHPGERLEIVVSRKARERVLKSWASASYRVDQPIETLWLQVERGSAVFEWHSTEEGISDLHVGRKRRGSWSWSPPALGTTYGLSGHRADGDLGESDEVYSLIERGRQRAEARERAENL